MRSSAEPGVSPTLAALAGTRADPVCFTRAADRRDRRGVYIVHADPWARAPVCLSPTRIALSYLTDLARVIAARHGWGMIAHRGAGRLPPRGRCRGL